MKKTAFSIFVLFLIGCGDNNSEKSHISNSDTIKKDMEEVKKDYEIKSMTDIKSDSAVCWGDSFKNLQLGISSKDNMVNIYLKNSGPDSVKVFSHVKADRIHLDPFVLFLKRKNVNENYKEIRLLGERARSAPVYLILKKDEVIVHNVDLLFWLHAGINGDNEITPGTYELKLEYEVSGELAGVWMGKLETGPIDIVIK